MKQRVFNVTEMYRMGLSKGEMMNEIGAAYEAEVADTLARKMKMEAIADAKKRVANDTYTLEDLELLKEGIKFRVAPPSSPKAKTPTKPALKTLDFEEFEDLLTALGKNSFF